MLDPDHRASNGIGAAAGAYTRRPCCASKAVVRLLAGAAARAQRALARPHARQRPSLDEFGAQAE
jgi:hypothetical protein